MSTFYVNITHSLQCKLWALFDNMRLFILMLSIGSVVSFGYALAGYGSGFFDKGRPDYVIWGLASGFFCACLAIYLWKSWLAIVALEIEREAEKEEEATK